MIDVCCNCGDHLGDGGGVHSIPSTWNASQSVMMDDGGHPQETGVMGGGLVGVGVEEALSYIFELAPLTTKGPDAPPPPVVFGFHEDPSMNLVICTLCADSLVTLYNSYRTFTALCAMEGEVARRLTELQNRRGKEEEKGPKRKRGRPPKKKKGGVNLETFDDGGVEVKREAQSVDEEGGLSDLEDELFFKGRLLSESDSPPDSPVNLEADLEQPRSPRPVRKSSARNKDWAVLFKDELDEEEEEEERAEAEATEADPDGNVSGLDDSMSIEPSQKVEVTLLTEGEDTDLGGLTETGETHDEFEGDGDEDFDDDEEYRPDEDLEELNTREKGNRRRPKVTPSSSKLRGGKTAYVAVARSLRSLMWRNPCGELECLQCGKTFAHEKSLSRHCRTHTEEDGSVECPTCGKLFTRDDHLKRHRKKVHGEDIPAVRYESQPAVGQRREYDCSLCDVGSLPKKALEEHVASVHPDVPMPWKCAHSGCDREFATFSELSKHRPNHYERKREKCDVCNQEFRSGYHLKRHQISIHHVRNDKEVEEDLSSLSEEDGMGDMENITDEQGNILITVKKGKNGRKCPECKKRFSTNEKIREHLILHGIGERFKCDLCGREFNHSRSKQRHMALHSEDNPYRCSMEGCDKFFTRKDHLLKHLLNVHGLENKEAAIAAFNNSAQKRGGVRAPVTKEVQCPHCDKIVKRERLRLHMVIHTGERRHMCDLCGQKFGLRTTLLTHIQCVHQGVRRYTCTYCGQAFKRSNHLKDHEKLHTDADSKPWACDVCGKAFRREKNLKSHMVCHIGSKDFMCEICGKAFNRIDNMRAHVKTVHQGLCIRKKKPSTRKSGPPRSPGDLLLGAVEETEESPPDGQLTLEGPAGSSVIVEVRKQPAPPQQMVIGGIVAPVKRGGRRGQGNVGRGGAMGSRSGGRTMTKVLTATAIPTHHQELRAAAGAMGMSETGTLVSLAINPENPSEVMTVEGAELLGAGGTTTILQLAPGTTVGGGSSVLSSENFGNFTTYYLYQSPADMS